MITIPVTSANLYSYLSAKTAREIAAGMPLWSIKYLCNSRLTSMMKRTTRVVVNGRAKNLNNEYMDAFLIASIEKLS